MKRFHKTIACSVLLATILQPLVSNAEILRYNYTLYGSTELSVPGANLPPNWSATTTSYGEWENIGIRYECSDWSPSPSTVGKGIEFNQTTTDCKQDQERWTQKRIKNTETGEVADYEAKGKEYRTISGQDVRTSIGIIENWVETTPVYTPWIDTNALYDCSSWAPSPSSYAKSAMFTQTSTSCKTDQTRERQDQEQEKFTEEVRNSGQPITENQTLMNEVAYRQFIVSISEWVDRGDKEQCSNWSPAQNTIDLDFEFTQTATDCEQKQERTRNEAYIDQKTGLIVQLPSTNESQTLTGQTSTQKLKGTKVTLTCQYNESSSYINMWDVETEYVLDYGYTVRWNGKNVAAGYWNGLSDTITATAGGYKYTTGKFVTDFYTGDMENRYYYVCREAQ